MSAGRKKQVSLSETGYYDQEEDELWAPEHDWILQFDTLLASKRVDKTKRPAIAKPVVDTNLKASRGAEDESELKVVRPLRRRRRESEGQYRVIRRGEMSHPVKFELISIRP